MEEIKYLEMFRDLKINKKELSLNLKGKLSILEESINEIANEMNAHKNEVNHLKSEKDSIQELLKSKHDEVKNTLIQDLNKVEEEMKRHFGHQKAENSRLQQQISQLKTEKIVLQQQLISLQKRIVDLEMQVGNDDDKNNNKINSTVFNVGMGQELSLKALYDSMMTIAKKYNIKYSHPPVYQDFIKGDIKHSCANIDLARQELNFHPSANFYNELENLFNWISNHE